MECDSAWMLHFANRRNDATTTKKHASHSHKFIYKYSCLHAFHLEWHSNKFPFVMLAVVCVRHDQGGKSQAGLGRFKKARENSQIISRISTKTINYGRMSGNKFEDSTSEINFEIEVKLLWKQLAKHSKTPLCKNLLEISPPDYDAWIAVLLPKIRMRQKGNCCTVYIDNM